MGMNEHTALSNLLTENLVYEITKALALPQTQWVRKLIAALASKAIQGFTELASELDCDSRRGALAPATICKGPFCARD
jgi:hypothetical protein